MPSTVIRRYAFRPAQAVLDVEFVSGRVYRYRAGPEPVARRLGEVRSKGGYFNRAIRNRFACEALPGWGAEEDWPEHDPAFHSGAA